VRRAFRVGDWIELDLPMRPRVIAPDPRVDAVRGCVAIERGPEVLALESVDFGADTGEAVLRDVPVPVEDGDVVSVRIAHRGTGAASDVALIPYHEWAQRGPSTMRVWIPTS